MSLIRKLLGAEQRSTGTLREPPDWLWDAFGAQPTYTGKRIDEKAALELDAVWACVTLLASSIAQMPLIVYRGEGRDRERAKNTWQWDLLHERPNPNTAPDVFTEDTIALLNLWGDFYAEKVKGGREGRQVVGELWRIAPGRVQVELDKTDGKTKRYVIDGEERSYDSGTILHIPGFGYNGRCGLSPIQIHRQTLGIEAARDEAAGRWYANQSTPPGVITVEGELTDESALRLKSRWESAHRGLGNYGRVAVLEDGATYTQIGIPVVDEAYILANRFGVNRIARMFQVPPEKIGGERANSNTYSNVQSYAVDFVVYSLQRWMVRVEQGLKHDPDLFPPGLDLYPEFLAESLLRGDPKSRADYYEIMSRIKAITVNEIRERENFPPVDWGDNEPSPPGGSTVAPSDTPSAEDVMPPQNGQAKLPAVA